MASTQPTLVTPYLTLEPVTVADLDLLCTMWRDPRVRTYLLERPDRKETT